MDRRVTFLKKIMTGVFTYLSLRTITYYQTKPKVNFYSRFNKNTFLGKNCHFNGVIVRGRGQLKIGDNFHSGKQCLILNSYHKYDGANALPYDTKKMVHKDVFIGDNVWIGDRVIILGGITIGEGAIIQAGSVVSQDIPKYGIAGGNPARVFKQRNIEEYKILKKNERYS